MKYALKNYIRGLRKHFREEKERRRKYEFTGETDTVYVGVFPCNKEHVLHRIRCKTTGTLGGWIEKEENLSQKGMCWVDGNAKVFGDAVVKGDAVVCEYARVYGNARVSGTAVVSDQAQVFGDAVVKGNAEVSGKTRVFGKARVDGNAEVSGNACVSENAELHDFAEVYGSAKVGRDACLFGHDRICDRG